MQNALKRIEWRGIWVWKTFKIEIQKRGPSNSSILQNWFPPEIRSPLFDFRKFQDSEKSTPESSRIHWNVMNDEELGSIELLRLKCRRGDQIIQTFCKIGTPEKLGPPSMISRNSKTLRKVLPNHAKYIEMEWTMKILRPENS